MIHLKRVYESPSPQDGQRILVERLWPRGLSKEKAHVYVWLRDIAPSPELRKWYNHDIAKWPDFQKKYREELHHNTTLVEQIKELVKKGTTTFVYAAKDTEHNSAVVLRNFLQK